MAHQADNPPVGVAETLEPGLRRVLAPNPSPMTFWGTNTYLLGTDPLVIIDPGPLLEDHKSALLTAIGTAQVSHIVVTHAHLDHSPLAAPLSHLTSAPVLAFGPASAGRRPVMTQLAESGFAGGGEGIDAAFSPDVIVQDGEVILTDAGPLSVLWTPGHLSNHISLAWRDMLFSGDHVMGWATSLVSPPDGDLTAFMASCEKLLPRTDRIYYPGHGAPIDQPQDRVSWLIAHRRGREASILETLETGPKTPNILAAEIYQDTPQALLPAAARNVFAHLIDLSERGVVTPIGPLGPDVNFKLT